MARVPYLDRDDLDEEHRHVLDRPINLFRALSNSPDGSARFLQLADWIRWESSLDARLRELIILQVGYLTKDEYEWSHHVVLAQQFGATEDDIQGLIDHAEGRPSTLREEDTAVLDAVRRLTLERGVDDDCWAAVAANRSDRELTEIVLVASFYTMVVRILGSLKVDVEDEYRAALERFPLR
jgi:alkylhydroperoxidase family enzyme